MWEGTPRRVHIKINPPNNLLIKIFVYDHTHFVPISALYHFCCLRPPDTPAPHSVAHHPRWPITRLLIAAAAAFAIAIAIDVATAANVSSAAACS